MFIYSNELPNENCYVIGKGVNLISNGYKISTLCIKGSQKVWKKRQRKKLLTLILERNSKMSCHILTIN